MVRKILAVFLVAASAAMAGPFIVGDVFASVSNGKVMVFSQTGVLKATLDTTLGGYTTGSTFDSAGNFYVTNFSSNTVVKFDPSGTLLNTAWSSGFGSANESIVFDKNGDAYIGYAGATSIRKVDSTGAQIDVFNVASNTDWIDLNKDQKTMVYSEEGNTLRRWDVSTDTAMTNLAVGSGPFYAKRYLLNDELLVASGNGNVYRYSAAGALLQTYATGISGGVFALNLDPNGTSFWTGQTGGTAIKKINIATGATEQFWSTGFGQLYGLSVLGEIQAGGGGVDGGGGSGVPEPSTFLLLGAGLAALAALRRRA